MKKYIDIGYIRKCINDIIDYRRRQGLKADDDVYTILGSIVLAVESAEPKDVVYLNRDELLAWANDKKEKVGIGLSEYDAGEENGKCEILNELIQIITLMK